MWIPTGKRADASWRLSNGTYLCKQVGRMHWVEKLKVMSVGTDLFKQIGCCAWLEKRSTLQSGQRSRTLTANSMPDMTGITTSEMSRSGTLS